MRNDSLHDYRWDGENRLVAITNPLRSFVYGPDGLRLKKITPSSAARYLGSDIERRPDCVWIKSVTPDLVRVGGYTSWLTRDHQNSVQLVTDNAGAMTWKRLYAPYGFPLPNSDPCACRRSSRPGKANSRVQAEHLSRLGCCRVVDAVFVADLSDELGRAERALRGILDGLLDPWVGDSSR